MKSEFVSGFDIAARIFKSLANAVCDAGGSDADLRKIEADSKLRRKIAELVVGPIAPVFSCDMREEGWILTENVSRNITSIKGLELVQILKPGEDTIGGEEMVHRARKELNANLGQEDAEWLLEHQAEIPKEWRNCYISFPGTVWQGSDGDRYVPYLSWYGGRWYLSFDWLKDDWYSLDRLLSFCG